MLCYQPAQKGIAVIFPKAAVPGPGRVLGGENVGKFSGKVMSAGKDGPINQNASSYTCAKNDRGTDAAAF